MTHREDAGGWAGLEELEETLRKAERRRKQLKSNHVSIATELAHLRDQMARSTTGSVTHPLIIFDLEDQRRLECLIWKFALSPMEAHELRQTIADLAVTFDREVAAILQELEALK